MKTGKTTVTLTANIASIEYKNGRHFLRDEKSANGTFINGERIVAPTCLCVGDEMKFGETIVRYEVM